MEMFSYPRGVCVGEERAACRAFHGGTGALCEEDEVFESAISNKVGLSVCRVIHHETLITSF